MHKLARLSSFFVFFKASLFYFSYAHKHTHTCARAQGVSNKNEIADRQWQKKRNTVAQANTRTRAHTNAQIEEIRGSKEDTEWHTHIHTCTLSWHMHTNTYRNHGRDNRDSGAAERTHSWIHNTYRYTCRKQARTHMHTHIVTYKQNLTQTRSLAPQKSTI